MLKKNQVGKTDIGCQLSRGSSKMKNVRMSEFDINILQHLLDHIADLYDAGSLPFTIARFENKEFSLKVMRKI